MLGERYEKLKVRAIRMSSAIEQHKRTALDLKQQFLDKKEELQKNQQSSLIQDSAIQTLKEIVDRMSSEHIERVVNLLTYALQTVFFDKEYSVELLMGDKRNAKTAEFYLVENRDKQVVRTEFEDGIGGGIQVVVGFVLQVFYIEYFGLSPIMFLDESFSQLSDVYIPYLKELLNQLADRLGFIFVLVSHDSRLIYGAKKTYLMNDGVATVVDEKTAVKVASGTSTGGGDK